jgi:hypothetical protein
MTVAISACLNPVPNHGAGPFGARYARLMAITYSGCRSGIGG